MEAHKFAIFALTRGYEDVTRYELLIARNNTLNYLLDKYQCPVPIELVLFHEGNIPDEHQKYICSNSKRGILFVNAKNIYSNWDETNPYKVAIGPYKDYLVKGYAHDFDPPIFWTSGYRNMCHFYAVGCINLLSQIGFTHALRVDEDCILHDSLSPVYDLIVNQAPNLLGTPALFMESHKVTNDRLPRFLKLTNLDFYDLWKKEYYQESPMLYSNVCYYNIKLLSEFSGFKIFSRYINQTGIIHRYRIGDAPLLYWASQLVSYGPAVLDKLTYTHLSHNAKVKDGKVSIDGQE